MKNKCNKMRPLENPYEIWTSRDGQWEWRVLRKYQAQDKEGKNEYARWLCGVKSPFTYGEFEIGDSYVIDVKMNATCTKFNENE